MTRIDNRLLPPERRLSLYLGIARRMRKLGPEATNVRHAAVEQAWQARREIWIAALADLLDKLEAEA